MNYKLENSYDRYAVKSHYSLLYQKNVWLEDPRLLPSRLSQEAASALIQKVELDNLVLWKMLTGQLLSILQESPRVSILIAWEVVFNELLGNHGLKESQRKCLKMVVVLFGQFPPEFLWNVGILYRHNSLRRESSVRLVPAHMRTGPLWGAARKLRNA